MKTISFIELCELIKEGNAPREIIIGEEVFRRKFIYDEDLGYLYKDKDYIMGFYSLEKILQEPIQIPTEPLLTDKEKAYLKAVIEPFREENLVIKVNQVCNNVFPANIMGFIKPNRNSGFGSILFDILLKDEEFKGLELNKVYSLQELDLD